MKRGSPEPQCHELGLGRNGRVVGEVDILAEQLERLGHPAQSEELRFEATYPHSHSLPFLIFPDNSTSACT